MPEEQRTVSAGDVRLGARVYDADGQVIGDVNKVVNNPTIGELYFEVHTGGVLGLGGRWLYVPFTTIDRVGPGPAVYLACRRAEVEQRFARKPGR